MLEPDKSMHAYSLHPYVSSFIRGLYPDEMEWWERKVSSRAHSLVARFSEATSCSDLHVWVPRKISRDELLKILAMAEEDVKGEIDRARIHGRETRRAAAELQRLQGESDREHEPANGTHAV